MININFVGNINNDSLQVGDLAYYITPSLVGSFQTSITTGGQNAGEYNAPTLIGVITAFSNTAVQVAGSCSIDPADNTTQQLCDDAGGVFTPPVIGPQMTIDNSSTGVEPGANDFIMFAKDSRFNISGLIGYYAEATFKNNSTEKAELYSVASEITPSSK